MAAALTLNQALEEYGRSAGPDFAARVRRYLVAGGTNDDTVFARYVRQLEQEGMAPGTVDLHIRTIRAFYSHFRMRPPEARGWHYDAEDANRPMLSMDLIQAFIMAAKNGALTARQAALVALSTTYGLRAEEMARVQERDVDLAGTRVYIRTAKGGKPRWCWLPPEIVPILDVNWPHSNRQAIERAFGDVWAVAVGTEKPEGVAWHSIRRALVAEARAASAASDDVERFMRWSSGAKGGRRMVELYSRPNQVIGAEGAARARQEDAGAREFDAGMWDHHPFVALWQ